MIEIHCPTDADTRAAARRLAALCRPGDVIVLNGRLGAGKTAFAGGLADGLGVDEQVTSPSFVLMRSYRSGFLPFFHVDAYRLGSIGEFEDLAALESAEDGVVVIDVVQEFQQVVNHQQSGGFVGMQAGLDIGLGARNRLSVADLCQTADISDSRRGQKVLNDRFGRHG